MAQHDYVISNGTGAAVRSDLNNALSAIVTQNSGSTEPTTTYAYQMWADTNAGVMKIRNGANSAWITLYQLDGEWTSIAFENGSAAAPSIYFKDSGTDTGFFSGGTDQVNIATAGTERVEWGTSEVVFNDAGNNYDFRVEGDTNANLLFVDASADAVGIGTSSPGRRLVIAGDTNTVCAVQGANNGTSSVFLGDTDDESIGALTYNHVSNHLEVKVNGAERVRVDSSGRVGIGTTSPVDPLHVIGSSSGGLFEGSVQGVVTVKKTGTNGVSLISPAAGVLQIYDNNGSAERARIDSSGRWLLGTSSSVGYGGLLQVVGGDTARPQIHRNINDIYPPIIYFSKARGTGAQSVSSGDALGQIGFVGYDGTGQVAAATIECLVDGTPGTNDMPGRLVFSTTADGASSPTERMRISNTGGVRLPDVYNQTIALSANVFIDTDGTLKRATSSIKYKTNVETLEDQYADAVLNCRPVWYQSTSAGDNPNWGFWGFIAEEVAEIDPRLVQWKTVEQVTNEDGSRDTVPLETPEPENVAYDRFVPHLLNLIKRQKEQIESLEARLSAAGI